MWKNTETIDNKIIELVTILQESARYPRGIPLQILYSEIRRKNILKMDWAISDHIELLEKQGKIKVIDWNVILA